jgi:hypothetical protein
MRIYTAWILLFFPFASFGQTRDTSVLRSQEGVIVRSITELIEKTEKRDKYRVIVTAVNGNPFDVFYPIAKKPQPNGTTGLGKSDPKHFALIILTNPGSFKDFMVGGSLKLSGDQTSDLTGRDEILFRIPAGANIVGEMTVYVRSSKRPELSCEITAPIKHRDAFLGGGPASGIGIPGQPSANTSPGMVWISKCNDGDQQLYRRPGQNGKTELIMTGRGRQTIWQQTSTGVFEKPGQTNARITHEPSSDIYTYTHIDGVVCLWRKR